MKRPVEAHVRHRLLLIGEMDLRHRLRGLVLERHPYRAGERALLWEDVDRRIDGRHLRLRKVFVLLEVALVAGLDVPQVLGVEILVEHVRVVVIPRSRAHRDHCEDRRRRDQPRRTRARQVRPRAERALRPAAREGDRDHAEDGEDREPIGDRKEERRHEVAVAIHVRVDVLRNLTRQVERIRPAEVEEHRHEHERADHDPVSHELVRDHRLCEQRPQREAEDLREGDDVQFLEVLRQLEVVVSRHRLHEDANEHRHGEQHELDDRDRGELREPIDGLAHRQRVVDTVEVVVALAPDELTGVQRRDDEEEERGPSFHGLQHEISHGPHVHFARAPSELAVVDREHDEQTDDRPERDLAHDRAHAEPREREILDERRARAEALVHARKALGHERANRPRLLGLL